MMIIIIINVLYRQNQSSHVCSFTDSPTVSQDAYVSPADFNKHIEMIFEIIHFRIKDENKLDFVFLGEGRSFSNRHPPLDVAVDSPVGWGQPDVGVEL